MCHSHTNTHTHSVQTHSILWSETLFVRGSASHPALDGNQAAKNGCICSLPDIWLHHCQDYFENVFLPHKKNDIENSNVNMPSVGNSCGYGVAVVVAAAPVWKACPFCGGFGSCTNIIEIFFVAVFSCALASFVHLLFAYLSHCWFAFLSQPCRWRRQVYLIARLCVFSEVFIFSQLHSSLCRK